MLEEIRQEAKKAVLEVLDAARLKEHDVLVVGCSTSEIAAKKIGSGSNAEIGTVVFEALYEVLRERGIYLAAQCCEHLNRAVIIEREAALKYGYEMVNAVPQPKAGGSFGTAVYQGLSDPVAVEEIKADAGMDIGDTLIGMHLKKVAVPVRIEQKTIGQARVIAARTRLKFVGGERAHYDEKLL